LEVAAMKLQIDETVIIRDLNVLAGGAKCVSGKQYLHQRLNQLCDMTDLILLEVNKVSTKKYQLCFVITENDSYNLEDDGVYFTADWYDIKILNDVVNVEYQNEFFGMCSELRTRKEDEEGK
jgi:hypothetical protein